jgi:hypothetical protein
MQRGGGGRRCEKLASPLPPRLGLLANVGNYSIAATFKPFDGARPRVVRVDFEAPPTSSVARAKALEHHDAFLHSVLDLLPTKKFVVVLTSSPISDTRHSSLPPAVAPEAAAAEHQQALELRSVDVDSEGHVLKADKGNETTVGEGLFHKYQFFTPAIMMGYVALAFLLAILYVGLSAISSVGVSYGAFEKEMGPAAQAAKKQS